ncbi:MAG TPA: tetratricopeptide repeat protein, partial [bacterium]|nr:tetratricopeptide repeat protein [bacterium]
MAVLGGLFSPAKKLEGLVRNGEAALQKRDFAAATTLFEQAKELLEKNRGNKETDAFGVKVNLGLARALHGQGRTEEVFQYVDRGLEFEGDKAQLLEFLGTTLPTPLKDPISPGAYRTYKKGYALAPGNEKILLGYAAGAYAAGDFNTETHKVFERAYRAHRDFMPAIHGLGQTLAAAKQYDQTALEIYRQLLKLEPQNEIHKLNLARAYALMEKTPADAFGVIQWARKLQPEDPVFFEGLTKIYLQSDEMLESIYEHLLEAYHRTPSTAIARRLLPYLLRAKDTSDFAVEIYEQFWRDHERRDQILYLLSEHYQKAKRIDQPAVEVYEALFEVNPGAVGNTQLLASLYAHANRHDARALGVYELALADTDPSTMPEVVKAAAKGYAAQGRKDARARELYFTHLENMPQDTEILLLLGDIALQKKVLDERDLIVLEKLFKLPPIPKDYKLRVAKILAEHYTPRQRADETAINIYRFLWQFEPESLSPLGVQLLAHEMARQGEASKYAPLLKKALDSRYDAAIASGLAQAYLKEGRLDQEAIAHYLRVLREDPTNEAILSFVTPKILEGAEPSPEYYPIILGALERNPKPVLQRLAGEKGRGILLKMSRFLVEQRQYREAQVALEAAKQNFPADSEIDYRLAVVLAAQGNAPAALGILQHLAKTNPEPLIQYRLGQVALMGGKAQEAGRVFEELGRQFPNHPLLTARRGQLAELTGQPDQARQHYQALAQSKTPYAPFGALKLVMLNGVASTNGDEASIQSLTKDPIFGPQAQALLALRYFKLGKAEYDRTDYRGAARAWEQALELSGPGSYPLLRAALAEVLFRLWVEAFTKEQFTQAEAHFKR